ncbi:MAG: DUF2721 domain-containing protein [Gammaproteobacteria bacterium]
MDLSLQITDISHAIELAVAPVFLLAGISGMLSVLSIRLGRIVDRARLLDDRLAVAQEKYHQVIHEEHRMLSGRARLANWAISLCTVCALLICMVIVTLFSGVYLGLDVSSVIAWLFIASMTALILGLLIFLREIYLATSSLRIGQH